MDVRDILISLNISENDLKTGTRIYESSCDCGKMFGYILIEPDLLPHVDNIVVEEGYEKPKKYDFIECLACGKHHRHAQDLYGKLIYKKEK